MRTGSPSCPSMYHIQCVINSVLKYPKAFYLKAIFFPYNKIVSAINMINDKQLQLANFILGEKSLDQISQI